MNGDQRHQVGIPENRMKRENYILMDKLDYIDHLEGNLRKTTVLALAKMLSLFNVFESTLFSKERLTVEERCQGFCKHLSKRGSPYLRKTLFVIMTILLQLQPQDDPVYQFLDKKRSEGKKYYVYMTAGMTKFLRIYYGKVRDCLKEKGIWDSPASQEVNPD